jgi:hypothetical protein
MRRVSRALPIAARSTRRCCDIIDLFRWPALKWSCCCSSVSLFCSISSAINLLKREDTRWGNARAALERLAAYDRWGKIVAAARWLALRSGCVNFLNRAAACCPSQANNTAKQGMEPGDTGLCRRWRKVRHQMQSSMVMRRLKRFQTFEPCKSHTATCVDGLPKRAAAISVLLGTTWNSDFAEFVARSQRILLLVTLRTR